MLFDGIGLNDFYRDKLKRSTSKKNYQVENDFEDPVPKLTRVVSEKSWLLDQNNYANNFFSFKYCKNDSSNKNTGVSQKLFDQSSQEASTLQRYKVSFLSYKENIPKDILMIWLNSKAYSYKS